MLCQVQAIALDDRYGEQGGTRLKATKSPCEDGARENQRRRVSMWRVQRLMVQGRKRSRGFLSSGRWTE